MHSAQCQGAGASKPVDDRTRAEDDLADALYLQDLVLMTETPARRVAGGGVYLLSSIALAAALGIAAILAIVVA